MRIPMVLRGAKGYQDVKAWDDYFPSLERQLPDQLTPMGRQTPGDAAGNGRATGMFDFFPLVAMDGAMMDGQAVSWLSHHLATESSGPRFMAAGIFKPHLPWYVPEKYYDLYPLENIELPTYLETDEDDIPDSAVYNREPGFTKDTMDWVKEQGGDKWREAVQGYIASMAFADAMVGEIIHALDQSGRADKTIIVLWSDHGFHLGEKNRWGKMTLWEETSRVPFIIVAPGITTPDSSSDEAVSLQSMYATLADLTDLEIPDHVEGKSLVPLLKDPGMAWDDVAITVVSYGNYTVRDDHHRYSVYADGQEELYDHRNDPDEWTNQINNPQYADVLQSLKGKLPPPEAQAEPPPRPRQAR